MSAYSCALVCFLSNASERSAHRRPREAPGLWVGAGAICMAEEEVVRELVPARASWTLQLVQALVPMVATFMPEMSLTLEDALLVIAGVQTQTHQSTVPPQSASIFMNSCAKAAFDRPAPKVGPSFSLKLSASSSPPSA